jgi:hypothetical protein
MSLARKPRVMVGSTGEAGVDVRRRQDRIELRCLSCQANLDVAVHTFQALTESINRFLSTHRHMDAGADACGFAA